MPAPPSDPPAPPGARPEAAPSLTQVPEPPEPEVGPDSVSDTFAFDERPRSGTLAPTSRGDSMAPSPRSFTAQPPAPPVTLPPPAPAPFTGQVPVDDGTLRVPGYRLLRLLGRGGMGEVHLAERVGEGNVSLRCVLKIVHPDRKADPRFAQQLLSEARIAANLRHPNIVSVFDVGRTGDQLWIAMEWVEGCDARALIEQSKARNADIPLRHVVYIVREALQGLHHAHAARDAQGRPLGVVHRDISPGNILISRHGAVKLADFGVAFTALESAGRFQLAGKPRYLAPELYRGAAASVQSDIFAMGATLYELLTMEELFGKGSTFKEVEAEVLAFDPKRAFRDNLSLPDGLEHTLLRALAPEPADRYSTALEMLEDVSDYAYEAGLRLLDAHFARYVERCLDGG